MTEPSHPLATGHIPAFIVGPGETDILMVIMSVFLVAAVLGVGVLFLRLHSLPERMAHRGHKIQFEIVAVLCLLALFTHMHIFWVAALLLALVDIPDFGSSLSRIAASTEKMAGPPPQPLRVLSSAEADTQHKVESTPKVDVATPASDGKHING